MNEEHGEAKIHQMIDMIKKEAEEKAISIIDDARHRVQKEKNKAFNIDYEKILEEFRIIEENYNSQKKLEVSRNINLKRIDFQMHREKIIEELKKATAISLLKIRLGSEYKHFLKQLILEGVVKLMETEIIIVSQIKDKELILSLLDEIQIEYKEFVNLNLKKDLTIKISVSDKKNLKEEDMGGVILYTNNYRISFDNTLKSRLNLVFESSMPDIRRHIFK